MQGQNESGQVLNFWPDWASIQCSCLKTLSPFPGWPGVTWVWLRCGSELPPEFRKAATSQRPLVWLQQLHAPPSSHCFACPRIN